MRKIGALILLMVFVSCAEEVPQEYIQPDAMVEIMTDLHLAEAVCVEKNYTIEDTRQKMLDYRVAICKKHQVDTGLFRKSFEYYHLHPQIAEEVQEKVVEKLNLMQLKQLK